MSVNVTIVNSPLAFSHISALSGTQHCQFAYRNDVIFPCEERLSLVLSSIQPIQLQYQCLKFQSCYTALRTLKFLGFVFRGIFSIWYGIWYMIYFSFPSCKREKPSYSSKSIKMEFSVHQIHVMFSLHPSAVLLFLFFLHTYLTEYKVFTSCDHLGMSV